MYTLFGIVLILFGALVMYSILQSRKKAEQAKTWRITDAVIVKSEVVVSDRGEDRSVTPRIEYRYSVAGRERTGSTIGFATTHTETDARSLVRKYPAGSTVQLRYNPDNADECCLETGADPRTFLFLICSAVLIGFGIFLIRASDTVR